MCKFAPPHWINCNCHQLSKEIQILKMGQFLTELRYYENVQFFPIFQSRLSQSILRNWNSFSVIWFQMKYFKINSIQISSSCWLTTSKERRVIYVSFAFEFRSIATNSKIVELGGQDEFYFLMIMLHFNPYINTLASNVKNNPTH